MKRLRLFGSLLSQFCVCCIVRELFSESEVCLFLPHMTNSCMSQIKSKPLFMVWQIFPSWSLLISPLLFLPTVHSIYWRKPLKHHSILQSCQTHFSFPFITCLFDCCYSRPLLISFPYHLSSNPLVYFGPNIWLKSQLAHHLSWPSLYLPLQQYPVAIFPLSPLYPVILSCPCHGIYQGLILLPVSLSAHLSKCQNLWVLELVYPSQCLHNLAQSLTHSRY